MADFVYMSREGIAKLRAELSELKDVRRPAVARAIAEARDKGDLSENAEYDAAREAQSMLELEIAKLEATLSVAREIDPSRLDLSQVRVHCRVRMKNVKSGQEFEYRLVPESEADLSVGKLSVETPIAQALLGRAVGDQVEVRVPAGVLSLQVVEISI